jgi:anti-anti-sigma regulatory factor
MVNITKNQQNDTLLVKISGSIEENVDFGQLIGIPTTPKMDVVLREVLRINSVGVKSWIKYFQSIAQKGIQLRFLECSTAIVEQINLISNFTCGGTVESIFVPFCCTKCNTELLGLFRCEDLKKINFELPNLKCSKCGGVAQFDDIPEEYFGFLQR